jgi:acyl carrier protein
MSEVAIAIHTRSSIKSWLTERVASYVRLSAGTIKSDVPLAEYGLDSVYALTLTGDIEDYLSISLDSTLMWDHPDIDGLSEVLIQKLAESQS